MPLHRPAYERSEGTAFEGDSIVLCCWQDCCCWQFCPCWQSPPWEVGCSRARQGECSLGASWWKLVKSRGSSWKSCLRVSSTRGGSSSEAMLERLSKFRESLDLLRDRLREFLLGELEKSDFFWRKPSRLLSLLLLILVDLFIILQQNYCSSNGQDSRGGQGGTGGEKREWMVCFGLGKEGKGLYLSVIIIMTTESPLQVQKVEKILLELNKTGLSYLKYLQYKEAIEFFKKAERIVEEELMISTKNQRISQLAGVTFNNLACYYKKTKRPKVALGYLKRSLELEVYKINDWVSTGSTHLNICAIYSYLGKHQQALNHVNLALELLDKREFAREDASEEGKSYWNIKMLCFYNKAIEEEYLRLFEQSLSSYSTAKQIAKAHGSKNVGIVLNCDEAIARIQTQLATLKKKMMSILLRKKEEEETGHYDFMRKHKPLRLKSNSRQALERANKFSLYKSASTKNRDRKPFFSKQKDPKHEEIPAERQSFGKQNTQENELQKVQRRSNSSRFKSLNEYLNHKNKTEPAQVHP